MPTYYYPYNVTSFAGMIQYAHDISGGLFSWFTLLILFFITLIAMKNYSTDRAFTVACFVTLISSFFFFFLNLLAFQWFMLIAISCGITIFALNFRTTTV